MLTRITIPNSVISIGEAAFCGCSSLANVAIGGGVIEIGDSAFFRCPSIKNILVYAKNKNYKSLDGNLYNKNGTTLIQYAIGKSGTSFTISNNVINIADEAFYGCAALTNITIPDSVTSIGKSAFANCINLIETEDDVQYVDKWAIYCDKNTTSVNLRSDTKGIADYAFSNCESIKSIIIPDGTRNIGDSAFFNCDSLTNVIISKSVESIGASAFRCCDSLTSATFEKVKTWSSNDTIISSSDLSNQYIAAKLLTDTYNMSEWKCE